jgi:transposase-like protein
LVSIALVMNEERMPQRFQRPYPLEFRREAVRLVRAGRWVREVAGELRVSTGSLRIWLRQH